MPLIVLARSAANLRAALAALGYRVILDRRTPASLLPRRAA
jgi:hypothetical protein